MHNSKIILEVNQFGEVSLILHKEKDIHAVFLLADFSILETCT